MRGGDQAQRNAVDQHAGAHPGGAQQAFRAPLGGCVQPAGAGRRAVELLPGGQHLHQQLPRRLAVAGVAFAHREVGAQGLAVVWQRQREFFRDRRLFSEAGVAPGREAPAEHRGGELAEVADVCGGLPVGSELAFLGAAGEQRLPVGILAVDERARLEQRRRRHHQTVRLDVAQPFQMGAGVRISSRHRSTGLPAAEVRRLQQRLVMVREPPVRTRGIDAPLHTGDHLPVREVMLQQFVIGIKQARSTHQGKSDNVLIVGTHQAAVDLSFLFQHGLRGQLAYAATRPARLHEPAIEVPVFRQFLQHFAADHDLSAAAVQPVPESAPSLGLPPAKHLEHRAGINDGTHQ